MLSYMTNFKKGNLIKTTYRLLISLTLVLSVVLFTGFMHARKIVTVVDGEEIVKFPTLKTDIGEILKSKDVYVFDQDQCDVQDDGHDITITISRAVNVSLIVGEERKNVLINPYAKVFDVIEKCGIELGSDDIINVDKNADIYNGMEILVNRVSYNLREEAEEIAFENIIENTDELYEGQTQLKVTGQKGEIKKGYVDKFIDGKLVETIEKYNNVTKTPVNEVVLKGTKKKELPPIGANAPTEYKRVISGKASAYSGGGRTSTGKKAARGLVAVDPRKIPYGTRLYISSPSGYVYGYAVAADCGGMMLNGSRLVDLYMDNKQECERFGVRDVNIYIL